MTEETKTYVVEWQETVTYSEEVEAKNKDEALMISGEKAKLIHLSPEWKIVDAEIVEGSMHIEEVQQ